MNPRTPSIITRWHTSVILAVIYLWEIKHLLMALLFSSK